MALTATDLPEPVVPATSRCGMRARSAITALPAMSLPSASDSGLGMSLYAAEESSSTSRTSCRRGLGSSRPMHDLPGMVSTTRMLTTDSARARSFIRLTIWLPLTPIAGSISKRVITGPGYAASTRTATPKSASLRSISREVNSSVSALTCSWVEGASSSSASGGRGESGISWNSGFCRSRTTRSDLGTSTMGGTTITGSRSSSDSRATSTACSRCSSATAPISRSRRSSRRWRTWASSVSMPPPMRSISRSHDIPVSSDQPATSSASRSNVAPLKPSALAKALPTSSPIAPPGACGNVTGKRYRRSASRAALARSTMPNPGSASHSE